uniref:Spermatogenesis-associated protein 22-like n=1 Tax=Neolamprologus brichardi TaxID=32507 RepID=A0A3Q4HGE1_NEOBR
MKRQENQAARSTSGCLSVPLFNQKKRNRVPLTALPSENEFFSHSEYTPNTGSQYGSNRPAPGPAPSTRAYGPIPHPYKLKSTKHSENNSNSGRNLYKKNDMFMTGSHKFQLMFNALLLNHATFVCVEQAAFPVKPATEHSLRILTAVIDGMRHWSQFKDKVPYLFEIFATLDSAVTVGRYGAKNFLLRDGKEVVQCVFYENEQVLPRLIRGQVHRCVGNYDRSKDVLMCVSVRPALPSELRNAQEAVKACDAEMRALVKSLSEV